MSEKKNFISNFLVIGSSTIINMLISLITTPIITRIVDPDVYGQLSIFNIYTGIAVMVLCLGLDQALVRFFYEEDTIQYKSSLLRACTIYPVIITIPILGIVICLACFHIVKFEFSSLIVVFLCINIFVNLINRIAVLVLRLTYQSDKYAISNIITKAVNVSLILILVFSVRKHYFLLMAIAAVASILASTIYAIGSTKEIWNFNNATVSVDIKAIFRYGLPLIFSLGITQLFQALDKISLNMYRTYEEVGIYSSAMSIISVFAIIQSTFNALWGPMQVEHYTKHPEDTQYISKANGYITAIMFFIGLSLILVKDIFALLLGPKFREAAYIMPFLIFNPIMYTISETTCSGIEKSKKTYLNIVIAIIACVANFIGNTLLVPALGGKGAAISTGLSYILFWAARTVFSNKYYYIDYHIKRFMIITLISIAYAGYNTFFKMNIVSVGLYCFCVLILSICYKNEISGVFTMIKKYIAQSKLRK